MKILDKDKDELAAKKQNNAGTDDKLVDFTEYRKKAKKKQHKHLLKLIVILLGVIAVYLVWKNADTIFEPFRGIASRVETKTSMQVGFPIELPASGDYSIKKFGDSFSMLTDTYLYAYDIYGEQRYAIKHGYSNPHIVTNDKRVLLFDKTGFKFSLYSNSSLLYQKAVDDKIVSTSIGNDNLSAVVTEAERYSNILYIYDDGGNWKYTRKFADENVMQVAFTGDGEHIIVSTISALDGDIVTSYYKFSIKSTEECLWKYSIKNNSLPIGLFADRNTVISVCDNMVLSLSTADGSQRGRYQFAGELEHYSITSEQAVVNYNDISTNRNIVIVLNKDSEPVTTTTVNSGASCVYNDENGIYILDGIRLRIYDKELIDENDIALGNDTYTKFVKIGNRFFLLGYNNIDMTETETSS